MTYTYLPLTQRQVEQIAYDWQYEGDFAFYDMPNDPEDLAEFLDTVNGWNIIMLLWIVHN